MNKKRCNHIIACLGALVLSLSGEGCATVSNTAVGSVAFPARVTKEAIRQNNDADNFARYSRYTLLPIIISVNIPIGVGVGAITGLSADAYFLAHRRYPKEYHPLDVDTWSVGYIQEYQSEQ